MKKITVKIEGMTCGMCEAHIRDTVRRVIPGCKKVSASRKSGEVIFLAETDVNEALLKKAIDDTGYTFVSLSSEEYKKSSIFSRLR